MSAACICKACIIARGADRMDSFDTKAVQDHIIDEHRTTDG